MYILTGYRLILTKDTKDRLDLSLVGLRWRGPAATVNYRPVFSSERALQNNNQ
jgi:hypothetical protein